MRESSGRFQSLSKSICNDAFHYFACFDEFSMHNGVYLEGLSGCFLGFGKSNSFYFFQLLELITEDTYIYTYVCSYVYYN